MSREVTRLGDLGERYDLHGVCHSCRAMRPLSMATLLRRLGEAMPLAALSARLRCQQCGSGDCGVRIIWAGARVCVYGNHDARAR
ncbi:MAG: hypothetical protein HKO62_08395 [Gammaproteobacteria bacterium]|nr:hypothetical protein [Gammaproteobacteria bacterium]